MKVEEIIKTANEIPLKPRTIIHIALVNNRINEVMTATLKPFEVSVQQFNVLRILRGQQGKPANLCTLNERMVTKMSNTTRLVDKLLKKGYVNRCVCPSNRRKVEIVITNEGLEVLEQMDKALDKAHSTILENFDNRDLEQLNQLLDKF
ncbi:MarR family winged helix-turn-helix transcriptional regulator [Allomuricauda sp. F6463D]|uniref:MarR family winged helix-turn-helix transcriptional regulator n=1 Tax=Allomuricauda sp. F6463D TaxID=2926409 RepID=UPI001FF686B0|nr:MarR family transcriptional regulator [Muricauda sp. F6463D]MCK0161933.1 MarR family transcriptional regulator [Muricauda sp. F6463D]